MATTRLADIIEPITFGQYMRVNTQEKTDIITSGLCVDAPELTGFLSGGGTTHNIPYWKDLDIGGGANIASDDPTQLAGLDKVQAANMITIRNYRTKGWSSMHLTGEIAGSKPMERINERVSNWWNRVFQRTIVKVLDGAMKSNLTYNGGDMVRNIALDPLTAGNPAVTNDNLISPESILDTEQTLGDRKDDLSIMIMHSVVETRLRKMELIEFKQPAETDVNVAKKGYFGKYRIVVDDGCTVTYTQDNNGAIQRARYTTILAAPGVMKWREGVAPEPVKVWDVPAAGNGSGEEQLWTRRTFVAHPYGYSFVGQPNLAGKFPTDAEYNDPANWRRSLYERKQMPYAFLLSNG